MPNTYQNPYGSTIFPITTVTGQSETPYGSTIFPTSTPTISSKTPPYGITIFPISTVNYPIVSSDVTSPYRIWLTDSNSSLRATFKTYNESEGVFKPAGIPLGLEQLSYASPFNTPNIEQGKNVNTATNPAGFTYNTRADVVSNIGNVSPGSIFLSVARNAAVGVAAGLGTAMTHQITGPVINNIFSSNKTDDPRFDNLGQPYSVMPFTRKATLINWNITKYKDFRSFKGYSFSVDNVRLDGTAAATRNIFEGDVKNSIISGLYAAATIAPLGGVYSIFNLESIYGFGNHGDPNALRRDFTQRSQVATRWKSTKIITQDGNTAAGSFVPTLNPTELVTEFRGDKVNVVDFGKRSIQSVYRWKPSFNKEFKEFWNNTLDFVGQTELTKDFIKFYFTGPKLQNGLPDEEDDIIVFRATIDSFSDTHAPQWNAVQMIGRADPNYTYQGYSRDVSVSFTVYATSRDEMKPIYRKLNALASYTLPDYSVNSIAMKSPWLRMTIGDLLVQQPVLINSLAYTFADSDSTWEINIENDPGMMQVPHKIGVQLGLHVITDYLPEKRGKLYSLAKQYDATGVPIEGGDNWLSDFGSNAVSKKLEQKAGKQNAAKNVKRGSI